MPARKTYTMADNTKDKQMAATLKARGVTRKTARCPLCHVTVELGRLPGHFAGDACRPRRPYAAKRRK